MISKAVLNPEPVKMVEMGFFTAGIAITGFLTLMMYRFPWWPLHPLGSTIAFSWPIRASAFSIFIAWALKAGILRVGGISLYRRAQDLFIGLLVGYVFGVILSLCGIGSQILIQTMVDDEVRGRVSSIWGIVAFGGTALGGLLVGTASTVWGLQNTVIVTGLMCTAAAVLSARKTS